MRGAALRRGGLGMLAARCEPMAPDDTEVEACFSWCTVNASANCVRCKCRACAVCINPSARHHALPLPVRWESDRSWFDQRVANDTLRTPASPVGCCPAAIELYRERADDARCCVDRRYQLEPLRPAGGAGWEDAAPLLANRSIYFVGDSLAEQHFVALAVRAPDSHQAFQQCHTPKAHQGCQQCHTPKAL
jgi:hypothetical protein